jgi:hypothetical protein
MLTLRKVWTVLVGAWLAAFPVGVVAVTASVLARV